MCVVALKLIRNGLSVFIMIRRAMALHTSRRRIMWRSTSVVRITSARIVVCRPHRCSLVSGSRTRCTPIMHVGFRLRTRNGMV